MFKFRTEDPAQLKTDMIVVPVCEDASITGNATVSGLVEQARSYPEFKGKTGDRMLLYRVDGVQSERVLFLGTGKKEKADAEAFRTIAGKAVRQAIDAGLEGIVFCMPDTGMNGLGPEDLAEAMMEGACLGNFLFDLYKQERRKKTLKTIGFHTDLKSARQYADLPDRVTTICRGTLLAREWVSMPPNEKRPDRFSRSIVKAADKENLTLVVLDDRDLKKNKMHALMAVGSGSETRPRMVIIDYRPEGYEKTIVLVGKGVTFDSGGINLKPGGSLEDMKQDMAGAAAVAATLITAARLELGHRIIGLLPLVENMPSGDAYRPGDIVRTASGKTVEIGNTDAEGRMILADAIAYAIKQYNPDNLIDMATLTGACVVALGQKIAGVFSSDEALAGLIVASGKKTHERCWAMPMPEDYKEILKSDFADIRNVGKSRWGGAIAAALFLSEFTGDVPWAHIDIAGPAYITSANAYCEPGGTGFGVRLLIDVIEKL